MIHISQFLTLSMIVGSLLMPNPASAQLEWRVSIKYILDTRENRPNGAFYLGEDDDVRQEITWANQMLDRSGRGYHFRLLEIVEVVGISQWFATNLDQATLDAFDDAAKANKTLYRWRDDAINVYINEGLGPSGICSFPDSGNDAILIKAGAVALTIAHECGHFLGLYHTQGRECGFCDPTQSGTCHTVPGNDDIADTAPDLDCWSRDDIAANAFGTTYNNLDVNQRDIVDNSFLNLMSYHPTSPDLVRLSPDQFDRTTEISNGPRQNVATGRTWFVDANTPCDLGDGSPSCNGFDILGPYKTVGDGVTNAAPGDIVLLRGGSYRGSITITKAVTLRASRGNVIVGIQ